MILITGGAGYIGSHVALNLLKNSDHEIVIFDNLENGRPEAVETLQVVKRFNFLKGDLRNPTDIQRLFERFPNIDACIHLASYIIAPESCQQKKKYFLNNFIGSLNLINALVANQALGLVFSSSAAVYGNAEYTPIDENHPRNPINPYGWTKLMVEEVLKSYDQTCGFRSISLRYFNVAGADSDGLIGECHQPETHLIPNILKASGDKVFNLYGDDYDTRDGTCIRDYVNVEDLAEAHTLALKYLLEGGKTDCFNLGTRTGSSVKEVFETCEEVTGRKIKFQVRDRRPGDPDTLVADNTKAGKILGWHPRRTLKDSIRTAYQWEAKISH